MSLVNDIFRYTGGAIALIGLGITAAFIGRRTADPMATMVWDPLPLWLKLTGIIAGLVVMVVGLAIFGRLGSPDQPEQ